MHICDPQFSTIQFNLHGEQMGGDLKLYFMSICIPLFGFDSLSHGHLNTAFVLILPGKWSNDV